VLLMGQVKKLNCKYVSELKRAEVAELFGSGRVPVYIHRWLSNNI